MSVPVGRVAHPIRVAVVASVDSTVRALLAAQVRTLQRAGYDVRCLCTPGSARTWLVAQGFQMVDVTIRRRISPLSDLAALWRMYRYFRRERVAVVHTHTPKPGLLGQVAAWMAGVPVIINTLHGFYFHEHMPPLQRRFYMQMEKLGARFSSMILSQNPEDVQTAIELRIAPPERVRFLGNGVDLARFDPGRFAESDRRRLRRSLGIEPEATVVTIIARLVREKGYAELFEAMAGLMRRCERLHLLIVGPDDPVKRDALAGCDVRLLGFDRRVHRLGRRDDIPELLACTDIFTLPSWREGFPRSAIEAAAMAVPIVATDIRGCRQVVEHEVNGLLVPLRDAAALEAAIGRLMARPEERCRFGRAGREKALREFDEHRICHTVLQTIESELRRKGLVMHDGG